MPTCHTLSNILYGFFLQLDRLAVILRAPRRPCVPVDLLALGDSGKSNEHRQRAHAKYPSVHDDLRGRASPEA
jgi:hypothetical protein